MGIRQNVQVMAIALEWHWTDDRKEWNRICLAICSAVVNGKVVA